MTLFVENIKKYNSIIITILFAIILCVGLLVGPTYGIGIDQYPEEEILFMNLRPYAELVFGADSKYTKILGESDICTDIERDHGAAPMYLAAPFAISGTFRGNPNRWIAAYRCCMFFVCWLGLLSLYGLVRKLTGSKLWGLLATLMMWLSPRFFAESTYNNMDTVAAACVLMSLYFGYGLYNGKEKDYFTPVLFGLCAAFSANVRLTGIVVFGLVGLFYIVRVTKWEKWTVNYLLRGIAAILSFCCFSYLITPAMWHGNTISFIKYVFTESASHSRWSDYILAGGEIFHTIDRPIKWWYSIAYMSVTIPPVFIVLILSGIVTIFAAIKSTKDSNRQKKNVFVLSTFLFVAIVLFTSLVLHTILYNGWRHLYNLYGPMIIIAVYGADCLCKYISEKNNVNLKPISIGLYALITIQVLSCLIFIIRNHPYDFAYFNVFAGKNVEKNWDGDWWGICSKEVLERTYEEIGACSISNKEAFYLALSLGYCNDEVIQNVAVEGFPDSEYIAVNVMYAEHCLRGETEDWIEADEDTIELYKYLSSIEPVFEIKSGNCSLWRIYEAP